MFSDQNSGGKSEPATARHLRDARKRGDVAKSHEITSTLGLAFITVIIFFALDQSIERLASLTIDAISHQKLPFDALLHRVGQEAFRVFFVLSTIVLLPVVLFNLLIELLQSGPVFALAKIQPRLSNLDPAAGIKKMFSLDTFIELLKTLTKTSILVITAWFVFTAVINEIANLPAGQPLLLANVILSMLTKLLGWTLGIYLVIAALDMAYQRYAYARKMRMSISDIEKEHQENEGDPLLKGLRRQLHQQWSQDSSTHAARSASVIVVNPTHIAIAIRYDEKAFPVPVVTAKAQDDKARAMRDAAADAFVPVLRNEQLARRLLNEVNEGDQVPRELFDMVAEIILWANLTQEKLDPDTPRLSRNTLTTTSLQIPGEDLSVYPPSLDLFARVQKDINTDSD